MSHHNRDEITDKQRIKMLTDQLELARQEKRSYQKLYHQSLLTIKERNIKMFNTDLGHNFYEIQSPPSITIETPRKRNEDNKKLEKIKHKYKIAKVQIRELNDSKNKLQNDFQKAQDRIEYLETQNSQLEMEQKATSLTYKENQTQLEFFRKIIDDNSNNLQSQKHHNCKVKIRKQSQIIADQRDTIIKNNEMINELNKKVFSQESKINRLETELDVQKTKNNNVSVSFDHFKSIQIPDKIEINDYSRLVPIEIQLPMQQIANNDTMQVSSKLQLMIKILSSYYNRTNQILIDKNRELEIKYNNITAAIGPFVSNLCNTVLNNHISFDTIVNDSITRSNILKQIQQKCSYVISQDMIQLNKSNEKLKKHAVYLENKMQDLIDNAREQELSEQNQMLSQLYTESQNTISQLNNKIRHLNSEQQASQINNQRERKEYLDKLNNISLNNVDDYERIIGKLKRKCDNQQKIIQSLSIQLASHKEY